MHTVGIRASVRLFAVVMASLVVFGASAHARDGQDDKEKFGAKETLTALSDSGVTVVSMKEDTKTLVCVDNTGKKKPARLKCAISSAGMLAVTPDGGFAVLGSTGKLNVVRLTTKPAVQLERDS